MKISKADYYFSLFIRLRDQWTCKRCGRSDPPNHKLLYKSKLQNSHFFGRTMIPVRWDEENCDTLCHGCHRYWEKEDRTGYQAFKVKQLGQSRFNRLDFRAHKGTRPNELMIQIYYYKELVAQGYPVAPNPRIDRLATKLL